MLSQPPCAAIFAGPLHANGFRCVYAKNFLGVKEGVARTWCDGDMLYALIFRRFGKTLVSVFLEFVNTGCQQFEIIVRPVGKTKLESDTHMAALAMRC